MFKKSCTYCFVCFYLSLCLVYTNAFSQEEEIIINESSLDTQLAKKRKQAKSLFEIAKVYRLQKDYPSTINNFLSCAFIYESLNDVEQVAKVYFEIAQTYQSWNAYDKALEYSLNTYLFAKNLEDKELEFLGNKQIAQIYFQKGNYKEAISRYKELLNYVKKQGNLPEQILLLEALATAEKKDKLYKQAHQHYIELLGFTQKEQGASLFSANVYTNLGFLNQQMKKPLKALKYFQGAGTIYKKNDKQELLAGAYQNIALSKMSLKNFEGAEFFYKKALLIKKKFKNKADIARLKKHLALNSYLLGNKSKAFNYALEAEKLAKEGDFLDILLEIYEVLAQMYAKEEFYKESKEYYILHASVKESLNLLKEREASMKAQRKLDITKSEDEFKLRTAKKEKNEMKLDQLKMKAKQQEKDLALFKQNAKLQEANYNMAKLEKQKIQNLLALTQSNLDKEKQTQEILILQKNQALKDLFLKNQTALREDKQRDLALALKDNELLKKDKQLKAEEMKEQAINQKYLIIISFLIGIAFIFMGLSWFKSRRKNRRLSLQKKEISEQNNILQKKQKEISKQRALIHEQHQELKYQNQQVKDSIRAAALIQQAILPESTKFKFVLGDYFIIYKPKDVVSGDFYWLYETDNKIFIAIVDCTGHGIPGALTAMIGTTLLDKIVGLRKVYNPDQILEQLHKEVEVSFTGGQVQSYYGMDLGLLSIEKYTENESKIIFAAAKRPLYYILPNTSTLIEIKGTRRMIGGGIGIKRDFVAHEIILPKGTLIYMGTDGFADQADEQGNRFGTQKLKKTLSQISDLSIQKQAVVLEQTFQNYIGSATQRDDILLIGFKI